MIHLIMQSWFFSFHKGEFIDTELLGQMVNINKTFDIF